MRLRSLLFAVLFYGGTVYYVLSSFLVALAGTPAMRRHVHQWTRYHHWLVTRLLRIPIEWEGEIPRGCWLIAVKHQAEAETLEVVRRGDTPVIVLKRELSDTPGLGWVMRRYGVIPVDREAGAKALREMLAAGKAAKAVNRAVVIYPEGTRTRVGDMPPLRSGFAGLYRALGLPVVPIAVDSGRAMAGLMKRPGRIRFAVGETIPAGLRRDEIEARVHAAINRFELAAEDRA
ncbi:lysophospholipid acyltransferase family protein [Sphingomonas ginkgonis]